jgi:XTP/dITP diphosphohydrolase
MKLVLATQNPNKVKEIQAVLPSTWSVTTALEAGITEELPETGETLDANAREKAAFLQEYTGGFALSDDSGLEVDALDGAPGVYSARYGGPEKDDALNRAALLRAMDGQTQRSARFRTVMAWATPTGMTTYEGVVEGTLLTAERGTGGFGYDALFVPIDGDGRTFAEMSVDEKKAMSHRSRALRAWMEDLRS